MIAKRRPLERYYYLVTTEDYFQQERSSVLYTYLGLGKPRYSRGAHRPIGIEGVATAIPAIRDSMDSYRYPFFPG